MSTRTESQTYPFAAEDPLLLPPALAELREREPVARVTVPSGDDVWLVTGYEAARAVLADGRFSRNIDRPDAARLMAGARQPSGPFADPPAHTRWRKLVSKAFTVRAVQELREPVTGIVDGLLDDVAAAPPSGRPVDLMEALAFPLPIAVVCRLLGIEVAQHARLRAWAATALAVDSSATQEQAEEKGAAFAAMAGYARDLVAEKRARPDDALLSRLVDVRDEDDGSLTEDELVATVVTLLIGGYENTAHVVGKALLLLFKNPEQMRALREDPSGLPAAVEEILRYTAALDSGFGSPRYATEDVDVGGTLVPRGATVLVIRHAANRDDTQFDDPERFDVDRAAGAHLGFGFGRHFCLGASLARLELEVGLGRLLARFPTLTLTEPADEVRWVYRLTAAGPAALPVTW